MVDDLRHLVEANRQGGDLNETQSLSATLVLPPKPAPPPAPAAKPSLFSRWRKEPAKASAPAPRPIPPPAVPIPAPPASPEPQEGTGAGDGSASALAPIPPLPPPPLPPLPDLADTNATAEVPVLTAPPLPARPAPAPRSSAAQILLVAGLVVLLGLLAGAGFLLWPRQSRPKVTQSAAAPGRPAPPVPAAPTPVPTPAPQPLPATPDVTRPLEFARQAYTEKQYPSAIAAAEGALMVDPGNVEARRILAKSQAALRRQRQAQTPPLALLPNETVAAVTPVPSATTPSTRSPGETSSPAAATTASLRIHLVSDFPDGGVLIFSVNGKEVARKNFAGSSRGLNIFRPRKPAERRDLSLPFEVPAGGTTVRIYVAPTEKPAFVKDYSVNFTGGSSHAVEIQVSAEGKVSESGVR
jgi:hypothetical protein